MSNRKSDSGSFGFVDAVLVLLAFLVVVVWRRRVVPWWAEYGGLSVDCVVGRGGGDRCGFGGCWVAGVVWWAKRSGRVSSRSLGDGWEPGDRDVFAVVPAGSGRRVGLGWVSRGGRGSRRWSFGRGVCVTLPSCCRVRRVGWFVPCGLGLMAGGCGVFRCPGRWLLRLGECGFGVARHGGGAVAGSRRGQVSDSVPIEEREGTWCDGSCSPGYGSSVVCSVCFS